MTRSRCLQVANAVAGKVDPGGLKEHESLPAGRLLCHDDVAEGLMPSEFCIVNANEHYRFDTAIRRGEDSSIPTGKESK